jgi:hypothetical protein
LFEGQPAFEQQFGVPRCRNCYYVLENLPEQRCPECGTPFDFNDAATYTLKPPAVRWKLWLPGLLLAVGGGLALYLCIVPFMGFGWSATLVVPASAGAVIGYWCRVRFFLLIILAVVAGLALFVGVITLKFTGLLCGLMLAGIAVGPLVIGTLAGAGLRLALKRSRFDQRWHLPLIAFLLLPLGAALVERGTYRRPALETVTTSVVIEVPSGRAWDAIRFYEDVALGSSRPPPPLFRLGMPRPLYTSGRAAEVEDRRTCVYDKGRITKQVTEVEPGRRLAFRVVEQGFERHAMTLYGGSFEFETIAPDRTGVSLQTTYRPHLAPRWCWRPFEQYTVHTLHRHVLDAMAEEAER